MNKPVRGLIEGKPVLVIVDAQRTAFPRTPQLIEAARKNSVPIVFATDPRTEATLQLALGPNEFVIRPPRLSVFFGTELPVLMRELRAQTVILAGGETSTRVHYSFVDAHQHDYFCRVIEECMAGSSPRAQEAALRAMEYMQTGARRKCDEVMIAFGTFGKEAATTRQGART